MFNYLLMAIMGIIWLILFVLVHKTPDNNVKSMMQLLLLFLAFALIIYLFKTNALSLDWLL